MNSLQRIAKMFGVSKEAAKMFSVGKTPEALVIDLYGYVGDWWDANEAQDLKNILNRNRNETNIALNVHSYGGYVTEGLAIMNQLKDHPAKVTAIVQGTAASMASVVLMAADVVKVHPSSKIMIHEAETAAQGRADDLEKDAEWIREINLEAAQIYQEKTGLPLEQIQKMMKDETWMNGAQAIELGFADEMIEFETAQLSASAQMKAFATEPLLFSALDVYKNIPLNCLSKEVTAKLTAKVTAAQTALPTPIITENITVTQIAATPQALAAAQAIVTAHKETPTEAQLKEAQTLLSAQSVTNQPVVAVTAPVTVPGTELSAVQQASNAATEIAELCTLSGQPGKIAAFLSSGKTPEVVRTELAAGKSAELAAIPPVTTQHTDIIEPDKTKSMAEVAKATCTKMGLTPNV